MILFMLLMAPVFKTFYTIYTYAAFSTRFALISVYFLIGFTSFGPHMLVGLMSREVFPKAPATAGSFTKGIAQLGGIFAGYPTSLLVNHYNWDGCIRIWYFVSSLYS